MIDLLLRLVDAAYARDQRPILEEVNRVLNRDMQRVVRFALALAADGGLGAWSR